MGVYTISHVANVYVRMCEATNAAGIPCQAYHAGRPAKERSQVLEDWNEGRVPVVAATIAFGMGIDRASESLQPSVAPSLVQ